MAGAQLSNRRRLCEGWIDEGCEASGGDGLVMYPERAYVVQPGPVGSNVAQRVWYARGKPTNESLLESFGAGTLLVESYEQLDLQERKQADGSTAMVPKDGRWVVEGPFQRSDVRNANKRVYPRGIWEKLIADGGSYVQKTVRERGMLGHLEHPADGRTDGAKGAIVITGLNLKEDGVVWGRCELLDTPHGLILQEYTRKNVRWGVSSRGNGAVKDDGTVDESSFVLETWDAVMKPSVPGAYPTVQGAKAVEAAKPNTAPAAKPVAESVAGSAYVARVTALSETSIDDLSIDGRVKLTGELIAAMGDGSNLVSANDLAPERVVELQAWLTRKLSGLAEAGPLSLDRTIDEAIAASVGDGEEQDASYTRVVTSLKHRLSDSIAESADMRERLEAAESRSSVLQEQCDELTEQLSAVEGRLADSSEKLKLAEDLLATRPAAKANGLVTAAVEEAIELVPGLEKFRDVLSDARSPQAVQERAERLLPRVMAARPRAIDTQAPVVEARRTSLPVGVVSSDDAGVLRESRASADSLSAGARLASAVVPLAS